MNRIRYDKKVKTPMKKIISLSKPSHQLISTAKDSLKEYHLSKSRICGERQLSSLSTPQITLRKTIKNAINRQQNLTTSLHDIFPFRKNHMITSRRASIQSSYSRESELMRKVTVKTEDCYPQICPKQFCLKRIRKLFKNDKFVSKTQIGVPEISLSEFCEMELKREYSPWQVREEVPSIF